MDPNPFLLNLAFLYSLQISENVSLEIYRNVGLEKVG